MPESHLNRFRSYSPQGGGRGRGQRRDPPPAPPALELSTGRQVIRRRRRPPLRHLTLEAGSIHALVGENGAGKSTLVKIIAGLYRRDAGEFRLDGGARGLPHHRAVEGGGHRRHLPGADALPRPLGHREHLHGPPAHEPLRAHRPQGDAGGGAGRSSPASASRIDPDRVTEGLSIADQQIIEIAKAISLDARVLIMDEPTAALSGVEVERLFAVARSLRDEGRALLFISHRFDEVFALCDTVTVMRDGATSPPRPSPTRPSTSSCGRWSAATSPSCSRSCPAEIGDDVLVVEGLTRAGVFHDISLHRALRRDRRPRRARRRRPQRGRPRGLRRRPVRVAAPCASQGQAAAEGQPARSRWRAASPSSPRTAASRGSCSMRASRATSRSPSASSLAKAGLLWGGGRERVRRPVWASRLEVKTAALDAEAGTLSGGNQQKVVLGKWLATEPKVLIVDEPTRGIDVGTKAEVHRLLSELAQQGIAILMISSELPEVLGMADRVLVMREGRLTGEFPRAEATPEAVMFAATAENGGRPVTHRPSTPARRRPVAAGDERVVRGARDRHPDRPDPRDPRRDDPATRPSSSRPTASATCCSRRRCSCSSRSARRSSSSPATSTSRSARCSGSRPTSPGRLFVDVPGIPLVVVFLVGLVFGGAARADQRRARRLREGARARHHPRHALHLPRHQRRLGGRRPHQRLRPARRLPRHRHRPDGSASRSSRSSPRSCSSSRPGTCATSAAGASSTRSAPTPPPRTSTASGSPAASSPPSW